MSVALVLVHREYKSKAGARVAYFAHILALAGFCARSPIDNRAALWAGRPVFFDICVDIAEDGEEGSLGFKHVFSQG